MQLRGMYWETIPPYLVRGELTWTWWGTPFGPHFLPRCDDPRQYWTGIQVRVMHDKWKWGI